MRWVLVVLGVIVLLGLTITLIGAALPQKHTASMSREYAAWPEVVWRTITDVDGFGSWRADLKSAERLDPKDGRMRWKEKTRYDEMTLEVMESVPPRRLVSRIADEGLPFGGTWTYDLAPAAGGTRLTITENGEVYNPFFRFVARFVMGYTGTMEKYHASLGKKLGAPESEAVSQRR